MIHFTVFNNSNYSSLPNFMFLVLNFTLSDINITIVSFGLYLYLMNSCSQSLFSNFVFILFKWAYLTNQLNFWIVAGYLFFFNSNL